MTRSFPNVIKDKMFRFKNSMNTKQYQLNENPTETHPTWNTEN